MEAGDDGLGNDMTEPFDRAANRCVLPEGQVRTGLVLVAGVCRHDPVKMCRAKHDQMVDALASYWADQPLHMCVLMGRMWGDGSIPDAQAAQTSLHDITIDGVTVSHEILRCFIPRKCLDNLPSHPLRGRVRRHGVTNEPPPAVPQDDQAIEQLEADRGHDKQVHGGNPVRMVAQEGRPTLTRPSGALDHILGDGRFGGLNAKLEQLAVDPRRPP